MKATFTLLMLLSAFIYQANAQADIRLYPSRLFFYQQEGQQQQKTVHLINKSARKVVIRAEIVDWKRDSTGNKIYYRAGTLPMSASGVMSVPDNTIVLEPGEDREVVVHMNDTKAGFKNAMLFFTQVDVDSLKKGLRILVQLGVHLYSLPEKYTEKQIAVSKAVWQDKKDSTGLYLGISNLTQAVIDTEVRAELFNQEGDRLETSRKIPVSSMPADSFYIYIPFTQSSKLKNGTKIILFIDNGLEYPLQVVEIPFAS